MEKVLVLSAAILIGSIIIGISIIGNEENTRKSKTDLIAGIVAGYTTAQAIHRKEQKTVSTQTQ